MLQQQLHQPPFLTIVRNDRTFHNNKKNKCKSQHTFASIKITSLKNELLQIEANTTPSTSLNEMILEKMINNENDFECSISTIMMDDTNDDQLIKKNKVKKPRSTKKVSFGKCHIREYNIIIGNHPECKSGLPITLGWKYSQTKVYAVDEYKAVSRNTKQRQERMKRLDATQRQDMLHEVGGYSMSYLEIMEDLQHTKKYLDD
mmetsp:Transcript_34918/g.53543  ORF Transcript_34918/g.53543 Transcript_34918/m.53543 type:complete len:203 (+) Transcript_34918:44-652(+)